MSSFNGSLERTRQLWTPHSEIEVFNADLEPGTPLDSQIRDLLHRTVEQHGPRTVVLERDGQHVLNTGMLRWEVAGVLGYRELSLWIEQER